MNLGLGTVQFGMDYGISNKTGQTNEENVQTILNLAAKRGIKVLDTAPLYGRSEAVIGNVLATSQHEFRVVTKTSKIEKKQISRSDVKEVVNTFHQSLEKLQQKNVYGLLFHHTHDLLSSGSDHLYDEIAKLKHEGTINKIGISVYNEEEIDRVLDQYSIDLVQLPLNLFDQRFLRNGTLKKLKDLNIEIHVRSLFLQGLMLMKIEEMPAYFQPIIPHLMKYHAFLASRQLTPLDAALGFISGLKDVDIVICGVNNLIQLTELLTPRKTFDAELFEELQLFDENYINPSKWKL